MAHDEPERRRPPQRQNWGGGTASPWPERSAVSARSGRRSQENLSGGITKLDGTPQGALKSLDAILSEVDDDDVVFQNVLQASKDSYLQRRRTHSNVSGSDVAGPSTPALGLLSNASSSHLRRSSMSLGSGSDVADATLLNAGSRSSVISRTSSVVSAASDQAGSSTGSVSAVGQDVTGSPSVSPNVPKGAKRFSSIGTMFSRRKNAAEKQMAIVESSPDQQPAKTIQKNSDNRASTLVLDEDQLISELERELEKEISAEHVDELENDSKIALFEKQCADLPRPSNATLARSEKAKQFFARRYTLIGQAMEIPIPVPTKPRNRNRPSQNKGGHNPLRVLRRRQAQWQRDVQDGIVDESVRRWRTKFYSWMVSNAELETDISIMTTGGSEGSQGESESTPSPTGSIKERASTERPATALSGSTSQISRPSSIFSMQTDNSPFSTNKQVTFSVPAPIPSESPSSTTTQFRERSGSDPAPLERLTAPSPTKSRASIALLDISARPRRTSDVQFSGGESSASSPVATTGATSFTTPSPLHMSLGRNPSPTRASRAFVKSPSAMSLSAVVRKPSVEMPSLGTPGIVMTLTSSMGPERIQELAAPSRAAAQPSPGFKSKLLDSFLNPASKTSEADLRPMTPEGITDNESDHSGLGPSQTSWAHGTDTDDGGLARPSPRNSLKRNKKPSARKLLGNFLPSSDRRKSMANEENDQESNDEGEPVLNIFDRRKQRKLRKDSLLVTGAEDWDDGGVLSNRSSIENMMLDTVEEDRGRGLLGVPEDASKRASSKDRKLLDVISRSARGILHPQLPRSSSQLSTSISAQDFADPNAKAKHDESSGIATESVRRASAPNVEIDSTGVQPSTSSRHPDVPTRLGTKSSVSTYGTSELSSRKRTWDNAETEELSAAVTRSVAKQQRTRNAALEVQRSLLEYEDYQLQIKERYCVKTPEASKSYNRQYDSASEQDTIAAWDTYGLTPTEEQVRDGVKKVSTDVESLVDLSHRISNLHDQIDSQVQGMLIQVDEFSAGVTDKLSRQLKTVEDGLEQIEKILMNQSAAGIGIISATIASEVYYQVLEYLLAFLGFTIWSWFQVYKVGRAAAENSRKVITWIARTPSTPSASVSALPSVNAAPVDENVTNVVMDDEQTWTRRKGKEPATN